MQYPLIIQGLYSNVNGSSNSIEVTTELVTWNNVTKTGRGNMKMLDIISLDQYASTTCGIINVSIGSMLVIQNEVQSFHELMAFPGAYEILQLEQPGGQSVEYSRYDSGLENIGSLLHIYYENKFDIPAIIEARKTAMLKQRHVTFRSDVFPALTAKAPSQSYIVPTGIGNIVGIQLIAFSTSGEVGVMPSLATIRVDGVTIFENVSLFIAINQCTRPGLIFPILIRGGSTIEIEGNTEFTPEDITLFLKLYVDDDFSGNKNYGV